MTGCCSPPAPSRAGSRSPAPDSTACTTCAASRTPTRCANGSTAAGTVVVVGAGWIGAEVAASARQRGLDVTVIDPTRSRWSACSAARSAVSTATSTPITASACCWGPGSRRFEGDGAVERVRTSDGRTPRLRLRRRRGRRAAAHATRRPGPASPSATGSSSTSTCGPARPTCSRPATSPAPSTRFYGERIRVEHWANALGQGPVAARNMLSAGQAVRQPAVLLLRPVRRRHGVLGLRPQLGPRRLPRRPGRAASSSPSGSPATACSQA